MIVKGSNGLANSARPDQSNLKKRSNLGAHCCMLHDLQVCIIITVGVSPSVRQSVSKMLMTFEQHGIF